MNVYYTDTAKQQLKELERHFQKRILDKVAVYASLPNPLEFTEPLAGFDKSLPCWRLSGSLPNRPKHHIAHR
jgi:hypothetical protein